VKFARFAFNKIKSYSKSLISNKKSISKTNYPVVSSGYCHCCRSQVTFTLYSDWHRDHFACNQCGSIPRQRHINYILDTNFPDWEKHKTHESSPSCNFLDRWSKDYSSSQYFENQNPGSLIDGIQCQDLERLSFDGNTFDLFVTQDVVEHVFNPGKAFSEIARVLKPGGSHIFTVGKHMHLPTSYPRAIKHANSIEHLFPPEFHGNPVSDGRALVTWDYGRDFEYLVSNWSSCHVSTFVTINDQLGLNGRFIEVFVMTKPT
jgi:SAM-dependent methyltransferase